MRCVGSTGCTFVDYDRDGKLDLFVSRYLQFDPKKIPAAGKAPECNFTLSQVDVTRARLERTGLRRSLPHH
jgi:hypothetical protein